MSKDFADRLPEDVKAMLAVQLPPDLAAYRNNYLREFQAAVREIQDRFQRLLGELILHEMDYLATCGWPRGNIYLPALNNEAAKIAGARQELITELGRLLGQLRRRLRILLDDAQDFS